MTRSNVPVTMSEPLQICANRAPPLNSLAESVVSDMPFKMQKFLNVEMNCSRSVITPLIGNNSDLSTEFIPNENKTNADYIPDMTETFQQRIEHRLNKVGLSASRASILATGSPDTIRSWFKNPDTNPRADTLAKVAETLKTTPEWLLRMSGPESHDTIEPTPPESAPPFIAPVKLPPRDTMPMDVPVMGTAAGSHLRGAFQIEGGIIDYVRRPPALLGTRDVYALYVEGTSMEPLYRPSGLVFVHSHKPPRIGDGVVVQMRNGEHSHIEATIGIFKGRSNNHVIIEKLNPLATIEIDNTSVMAVHKVLDLNELFGI